MENPDSYVSLGRLRAYETVLAGGRATAVVTPCFRCGAGGGGPWADTSRIKIE